MKASECLFNIYVCAVHCWIAVSHLHAGARSLADKLTKVQTGIDNTWEIFTLVYQRSKRLIPVFASGALKKTQQLFKPLI